MPLAALSPVLPSKNPPLTSKPLPGGLQALPETVLLLCAPVVPTSLL